MSSNRHVRTLLVLSIGALLLFSAVPVYASTYLTSGLTQSGIKQTTLSGYEVVRANYTNPGSATFSGFVYLDLVNSLGQTVLVSLTVCQFSAGQTASCFIPVPTGVATGTYTAYVFATTNSSVPVSLSSSAQVSL